MNVLFIHQNFPGQFVHLSAALAQNKNNRVIALGMNERPVPLGVELRCYNLLRAANPETHPLLLEQENHVMRAEACAAAALKLKREGFVPDVVVAHPGWGEALFIKDVFPTAKLVMYCEYYYALEGQDVGFDPEVPPLNFQQQVKLRLKNTTNLHSLQVADAAISPTQWQKSTYPDWAQEKITVIHDGIDAERLRFRPHASLTLQRNNQQVQFRPGAEVLTYVARNLEPTRGFHMLMRTLPGVLARRPNAHAIIVGGDEISYGHRAPGGQSWRSHMLAEVASNLDISRVHFLGKVPYSTYLDLLSISRVHTYWTTPFVLSWSFLEAGISGIPLIASDTAPVREFAKPLGLKLIDFFDTESHEEALIAALSKPPSAGRDSISCPGTELESCLKRQLNLINSL